MLTAYRLTDRQPDPLARGDAGEVPDGAAWVDLVNPTTAEDAVTEAFLGVDLPTLEESREIEFSSRFYVEGDAIFMTASLLTGVEKGEPILSPMTIVIAGERIVTLRYEDFRAVKQFLALADKPGGHCDRVPMVFVVLLEAIVDRAADVIEQVAANVDRLNSEIFTRRSKRRRERSLEEVISDIGTQDDIAAKTRESLASLERLVRYASLVLPADFDKGPTRGRLKLAGRDIQSLEAHITFLSSKINFLLDATLGLISVEQNEVIRVLTIVATFFFPPTLIGTVYGMNFKYIPELDWAWSYPIVLATMALSALLPFYYFKRKGWL